MKGFRQKIIILLSSLNPFFFLLKPKIFCMDSTRSSERLDEDEEWEDRKVVRATVVMSMSISFDSRKTTFPRRIPVKWLKPPFLSFRLDFFLIRGMSKLSRIFLQKIYYQVGIIQMFLDFSTLIRPRHHHCQQQSKRHILILDKNHC